MNEFVPKIELEEDTHFEFGPLGLATMETMINELEILPPEQLIVSVDDLLTNIQSLKQSN